MLGKYLIPLLPVLQFIPIKYLEVFSNRRIYAHVSAPTTLGLAPQLYSGEESPVIAIIENDCAFDWEIEPPHRPDRREMLIAEFHERQCALQTMRRAFD